MSNINFLQYTMDSKINENVNSLNTFYKVAMLDKALSLKLENPKMNKQEVANNLNISLKTLSRYSDDLNEQVFKNRKRKNNYNPQKCFYCDFNTKNKPGLTAHIRCKHLNEYISSRQNRDQIETNRDNLETKESLGIMDKMSKKSRKIKNDDVISKLKNPDKLAHSSTESPEDLIEEMRNLVS